MSGPYPAEEWGPLTTNRTPPIYFLMEIVRLRLDQSLSLYPPGTNLSQVPIGTNLSHSIHRVPLIPPRDTLFEARAMAAAAAPPPLSTFPSSSSAFHPSDKLKKNKNLRKNPAVAVAREKREARSEKEKEKERDREEREKREEANRRTASKKALSVILRREATKAVIEKKRGGTNSRKLLPRTVLEALHERITALRWESALKVFELLREQLWYRPNSGIYIKLIVMLGKCKQPERAHALFQDMVDEGCIINPESYTALVSAYSRSGLLDQAFSLLNKMKITNGCQPDVHTYSILIKSCVQVFAFDKVQILLSDMESQGIRPNTVTYNTLMDAYGKAGRFAEMESTLMEMLSNHDCKPDVWTMNATLRAFGGSKQIETMEKCYDKFQSSGISPDIKTFNILLDSYGKAKRYEKMGAVMEYMQKYYFSWTLVTYNVVIDAFGRAGDLKQMEYIFRLMKSEGIKPNCVTFCSLVRAYGRIGAVDKIKAVLRFIENSDVMLDVVFFNCLVDAYGRAGCLVEMREVPEMMKARGCTPDKITYSTMIKAYLSRGIDDHRVHDLRDLKREQTARPNEDSSL